ncbi:MAG: RdgB/HAM1 family non-canonical purine pyrophosphatase [Actinomycetota bacterium]|jgi:XTP/dITP diphosphohydrolase
MSGGSTRIVVATANAHKLTEIAAILAGVPALAAAPPVLVPMSELGVPSPVEDGATFAANALIKARACATATGLPALADDSGIAVEALDGGPGVRSARFAGEPTDDAANNALLLARLDDSGAVGPAARRAAFVCAAALVLPDGTERVAEGRMEGHVVAAPRGTHGFGYDPLFVADATPDGRTNGELLPAEKDAISHRGAAFRALAPELAALLNR